MARRIHGDQRGMAGRLPVGAPAPRWRTAGSKSRAGPVFLGVRPTRRPVFAPGGGGGGGGVDSLMGPCYEPNSGSSHRRWVTLHSVDIHHRPDRFSYLWEVRSCTRSGCREEAVVSLEFQYATSTIWIDDLPEEREPHIYELCAKHWSRFAPPNGWSLDDRRRAEVLPFVHRLAG